MDESAYSDNEPKPRLSPFFEKMSYREDILPEKVQQYVALYRYSGGLKSWSPDDIPGNPVHFGRKGLNVFLYGKTPGPKIETLGFLHYLVKQLKSGYWIVQIIALSTDGSTEVLAHSIKFYDQSEVWWQCLRWCRDEQWQAQVYASDSYRFIREVPLGEVLERRYFKDVIETRIEFERQLHPFLYKLCLQMDAAKDYREYDALYEQVDDYRILDRIGRGETLSEHEEMRVATGHFPVEFGAAYHDAVQLAKKQTQLLPQVRKIYEELIKPYIYRGYVFLPRSVLKCRIEERLGIPLKQHAFERMAQRYRLWCTLKCGAQNLMCRYYIWCLEDEATALAKDSIDRTAANSQLQSA